MTKQRLYLLSSVLTLCFSSFAAAARFPDFEVASIKLSPPAPPNPFGFPVRPSIRIEPGGRFNATQATLRDLIRYAYDLQDFRITGGAEWMNSARFDVAAKAEAGFSGGAAEIQTLPPMPQSPNGVSLFTALPEQFGLKLEPGRGMVEFLIVVGVERPTEN